MKMYEIFISELGTHVKFKVLTPSEVNDFVAAAGELEKEDFDKHVLENIIFNMKTEIIGSLKAMSRTAGKDMLEALLNGCIMLNPGLDIDRWVNISYKGIEQTIPVPALEKALSPRQQNAQKKLSPQAKKAKSRKVTKAKFLNLGKYLIEHVIGQDEAIEVVVNALKRSLAGLGDEERPLGVFLFAGASGIGKTLVAKELHKYLYGSEGDIVRIDCGEYQHKHDNQKLIGSPAGYIGHDDGGILMNALLKNPDTVVLLDEVEKAHSDVWDTFLRIFDEGMATDNKGRQVSFRNAIIIMTTNLGNKELTHMLTGKGVGFGSEIYDRLSTKVIPSRSQVEKHTLESVKKQFKPEFLNRIDQTVVFNYLKPQDYIKIAELELRLIAEKLSKRGLVVKYSEAVLNKLIEDGVDTIRGARGLAQQRREKIENKLADLILEYRCTRGTIFEIDVISGEYSINITRPKKMTKVI